ncbi:MAG: DNA-3-methyladenine glycosylase 2 family protein [Prevotellaceae bacterium]|nr:DNA-3-methyladenine glycosylase 2 family protein [Prevotellaceae bacterium]
MAEYFHYGEKEIAYLKRKDKRLGEVIERIGVVRRRVYPDLFAALVYCVIGQQISMKAQEAVWRKMEARLGEVTPKTVSALSQEELRGFGMSYRKAGYIQSIAQKIISGAFRIDLLQTMSDEEVCKELTKLEGIGMWSAEMVMLFSLRRQDVFSYGDYGIKRGLQMVYRHKEIDRQRFERYRKRFSPYGSVASLYLWEVAGGALK